MVNSFIKLPVVEKKRPLKLRVTTYGFLIACVSLFISIIYDSQVLTIISMIWVIVLGIVASLLKKFSTEGYLLLYPDSIIIRTKELHLNTPIKDLSELRFVYGGLKDDFYSNPKSVSLKDGTDNFIVFHNGEQRYSFELFLNNGNVKRLIEIFSYWRKINPNFEIIGEWGFKVDSF